MARNFGRTNTKGLYASIGKFLVMDTNKMVNDPPLYGNS